MRRALTTYTGLAALLLCMLPSLLQAGQKELMEAWSARKQAVTQEVYERLRQEGRLPRDGTVQFKAHTRPDPERPGSVRLEVDEVLVSPQVPREEDFAPAKPGTATQRQRAPEAAVSAGKSSMIPSLRYETIEWESMDVSGLVRHETLDIPVDQELTGRFEMREGAMVPATPPRKKGWSNSPGRQE